MTKEREKIIHQSSLTVGAVLLIFSVLTITYSIAGKQVVLYCRAGVTVPLRDNFKNISQIRYRSIPVSANTSPSDYIWIQHSFLQGWAIQGNTFQYKMGSSATLSMEKMEHKGVQWVLQVVLLTITLIYSVNPSLLFPHKKNPKPHIKMAQNFINNCQLLSHTKIPTTAIAAHLNFFLMLSSAYLLCSQFFPLPINYELSIQETDRQSVPRHTKEAENIFCYSL